MGTFTITKQNTVNVLLESYPGGGPGDIVSGALAWWGLRAYSRAKLGTVAIRLRRDSDNAEQDFRTVVGGGLDLTGISAFAGAANLYITKFYDQTGNGYDMPQTTAAYQPPLVLNVLNGLPAMADNNVAGAWSFSGPTLPTSAQPDSVSQVWYNLDCGDMIIYEFGALGDARIRPVATTVGITSDAFGTGASINPPYSQGVWQRCQVVFNSTSSSATFNGTTTTGDTGALGIGGTPNILTLFGVPFTVYMMENGHWNSLAFSSAQIAALDLNQKNYYGL